MLGVVSKIAHLGGHRPRKTQIAGETDVPLHGGYDLATCSGQRLIDASIRGSIPPPTQTFPLDSVKDALQRLRERKLSGRIVLLPSDSPSVSRATAA